MDKTMMQAIQQRQALTEEYATFSQSRGGLGKVLGGVAGIIVVLAGSLLGNGMVTAVITIVATLLWLIGKEVIRARMYRTFGDVKEIWTAEQRHSHFLSTGIAGFICAIVAGLILFNGDINEPEMWVYLAFVILLPFVSWRFLRTPLEFIVGVFLLAACAVHGSGGAYSLFSGELTAVLPTWSSFIGALVLIAIGWQEHRRFQQLAAQMQAES